MGIRDRGWEIRGDTSVAEADTTRRQLVAAFPPGKGFAVGKVLKAKDFVAERDSVGRGFMEQLYGCLLYTSPSPRDRTRSRMPSSA